MKHLSGLFWLGAFLSVAPSACVYDDAQRCGSHQVLLGSDRCACEPGYVPGASGCVPCGEDERESNGECVCVDGYARPAEDAACELVPEALGTACDTDSTPCTNEKYPLCHLTDGTHGYCTRGCSSSADCNGGYLCHEDGADGFCRRPPLGYRNSCESDDDCAEGEATYCDTIQSHLCLVRCSAGKTDVCFEGEGCCDFTLFDPICVPDGVCEMKGGKEVQ